MADQQDQNIEQDLDPHPTGAGDLPHEELPTAIPTSELDVVMNLLRMPKRVTTTAPTGVPKTFLDQIRFVDDGTSQYLYLYMNGAWRKVLLAAPKALKMAFFSRSNDSSPNGGGTNTFTITTGFQPEVALCLCESAGDGNGVSVGWYVRAGSSGQGSVYSGNAQPAASYTNIGHVHPTQDLAVAVASTTPTTLTFSVQCADPTARSVNTKWLILGFE